MRPTDTENSKVEWDLITTRGGGGQAGRSEKCC